MVLFDLKEGRNFFSTMVYLSFLAYSRRSRDDGGRDERVSRRRMQ